VQTGSLQVLDHFAIPALLKELMDAGADYFADIWNALQFLRPCFSSAPQDCENIRPGRATHLRPRAECQVHK